MADNSTILGQNFAKLPSGTTAERPTNPVIGYMRYNTSIGYVEYYGSGGWTAIAAPPAITGVSPTSYNGEQGTAFTVTGSFFDQNATVKFITAQGTEHTAGTVTYINQSSIIATTPQDFTVANEPLSVRVVNGSGLAYTLNSAIDCGGVPNWNTPSGTLANIYDRNGSYNPIATLSASDPDAGSTITYSITSGSIPPGTSLNASTGAIAGDPTDSDTSTTYNFTATATDNASNSSSRAFSIIVNTYMDGSSAARAGTSASAIKTLTGTTTSGDYWIKPPGQSAYQIYCDMSNQGGGWMLVAVGREGRADDVSSRDWWRDGGDTGSVYTTGLRQSNLTGSGNYNPRYMPNSWIHAACGGSTWNEVEMIINRQELGDSYYYRSSGNTFAWSTFESQPPPYSITYSRYSGLWLSGSNTYNFTNTNWYDTLNNNGPVSNDATRLFTWTWDGHRSGGIQYTGWSAGSAVTSPGLTVAGEGHALQFVQVFVR